MDCISTSSLSRFNHGDAPARLPGSQWTHAGGIKIQRSPKVWRNICSTLWHHQPPTQGWWKNDIYDPVIQKDPASCNFHMAESWSRWLKGRNLQETAVFFANIGWKMTLCTYIGTCLFRNCHFSQGWSPPHQLAMAQKNQPSNFQTIGQTSYSKNPKMPKENSGSATSSMRKNPPKIGFPDPTAWAMTAVPSPCSATLPSMLLRLRHRLPPARNGLKTLRSLGSP